MLHAERTARLSPAFQERLDTGICIGERMDVINEQLQRSVIAEFGFTEQNGNVADGLNLLRSAQAAFPNDPDVREASFYIKYNRAEQGRLCVGDPLIDAELHTLKEDAGGADSKQTSFAAFAAAHNE